MALLFMILESNYQLTNHKKRSSCEGNTDVTIS